MSIRALLLLFVALPAWAGADCGAWPVGIQPRVVAGKLLAWQGDFNHDGLADTVEVVSLAAGFRPPSGIALINPLDKQPAAVRARGEALALAITHGAKQGGCRRFLLVPRDFFDTPIWRAYLEGDAGQATNISMATAGTRAYAGWKRQVRALRGDGIVLATEAGIDILLYWKGNGYAVFWPDEEP